MSERDVKPNTDKALYFACGVLVGVYTAIWALSKIKS